MHELSVCQALLAQVERIAREHDAQRVDSIVLAIGPLSGVEAPLLRRAFPLAVAGSCAERALLQIETADVVVRCTQCHQESTVAPNRLLCGHCGDYRTRLLAGDELLLKRLVFGQPGEDPAGKAPADRALADRAPASKAPADPLGVATTAPNASGNPCDSVVQAELLGAARTWAELPAILSNQD